MMKKTLSVVNDLKKKGIISDYAIGGGIAAIFYIEPILTYDLDIFIIIPDEKSLQPLSVVYQYLKTNGYLPKEEQIVIEGVPVQFLPAHDELLQEAVAEAREIDYQGTMTRVMTVEHLLAIMLQTGRPKDRERFFKVMEEARIDQGKLSLILEHFALRKKFTQWQRWQDEK
jgi:hypothetical protein